MTQLQYMCVRDKREMGYEPYTGGISTAVYTDSHTLPHHARTLTRTLSETHPYVPSIYIYTEQQNSPGSACDG